MLGYYLNTSWRNFKFDPYNTAINLLGLTLSMTCCLIMFLYIQDEVSYDNHFERHAEIYRVANEADIDGNVQNSAFTNAHIGPLFQREYPEIEGYVRFKPVNIPEFAITNGATTLLWNDLYYADASVFDMFNHEILAGDPVTALSEPNSIAISASFADKYFGSYDVVGRVLNTKDSDFKITLVFSDLPSNTHLKYDALFSYVSLTSGVPELERIRQELWDFPSDYTYLLLPENFSEHRFKQMSDDFFDKYMATIGTQMNATWRFFIEPLTSIHLNSEMQGDRPRGNKNKLFTLGSVCLFLLLVAGVNYVILSIARSTKRAKEVCTRLIIGEDKAGLIGYFLIDSALLTLFSTMIAMVLAAFLIGNTPINALVGKELSFMTYLEPFNALVVLSVAVALGLLAGIYPAIYLSNIDPVTTLRGACKEGRSGVRIRQLLVILQFTVAIVVLCCTFLMREQQAYIDSKPLGFTKENQLTIRLQGADLIEKSKALKKRISEQTGVESVTVAKTAPGGDVPFDMMRIENPEGKFENKFISWIQVDFDFIDTLQIELLEGRGLQHDISSDEFSAVVVNETVVKAMGWKEPIGKQIDIYQNNQYRKVVGVVKDFHFQGLDRQIEPLVLFYDNYDFSQYGVKDRASAVRTVIARLNETGLNANVARIDQLWSNFSTTPMQSEYLIDVLNSQYAQNRTLIQLFSIASVGCILIACLGLYGLVSSAQSQRRKEIALRKVLGASSIELVGLLMKDIIILCGLAILLGCGLSFWLIEMWLGTFHYSITIDGMAFIVSSVIALLIAVVTITGQTIKTANTNPVESIRYE